VAAEPDPFPSYTQLPTRVPRWLWDVARGLNVLALLLVIGLLIVWPKEGLKLWWGLLVPSLRSSGFIVPGLWRNVCPLAAANQFPRRTGATFALTPPAWWKEYAPVLGMIVFLTAVCMAAFFVQYEPHGYRSASGRRVRGRVHRRDRVQGQERLVLIAVPHAARATALRTDAVRDRSECTLSTLRGMHKELLRFQSSRGMAG
jgi:hypothetical protein